MSHLIHEKQDIPCPQCKTEKIYRVTPYVWYPINQGIEPHYRWGALFLCEECGGAWIDAKHHFYPVRKKNIP